MRTPHIVTPVLLASFTLLSGAAHAGSGSKPTLHVDGSYKSCFFDLHPELTQAQFDEFADEAGAISRFSQLADARTIGRGRVEVALHFSRTPIDESKGAWNNTMSHPTADHYLGEAIAFPRLVVRVGVADRVDLGAWGSLDPQANYGFVGLESKIALVREGSRSPVSVALRPNASVLVGPAELGVGNTSVDLSVGRSFGPLAPYLGVAGSASFAVERTREVDLHPGFAPRLLAFGGLAFNWRWLSLAAQAELGPQVTAGMAVVGRS